jgi:hypothetical protein
MGFLDRLLPDPETKPINPNLVIPDGDLEADDYDPAQDMGDADNHAEAEKAAKKGKKP